MKKIVLLGGSLMCDNRGVNALTRGTIELIYDNFYDVDMKILSTVKVKPTVHSVSIAGTKHNIEEIPLSVEEKEAYPLMIQSVLSSIHLPICCSTGIRNFVNIIKEADLVLDISEGDSFADIYGIRRFVFNSAYKIISIGKRKKLILLPQTIGPFNKKLPKAVANKILTKSFKNYTRDISSYNYIKENCSKKALEHTANLNDMAFLMKPFDCGFRKKEKKLVGINVNALMYHGGYSSKTKFEFECSYTETIKSIISHIIDNTDADVLLIPHVILGDGSVEDDLAVCREIADNEFDYCGDRVSCYLGDNSEMALKYVISQCDIFIGARMHSCIAALSTCTPVVAMAYSRKFNGIWEQYGLRDYMIDLTTDSMDKQISIIDYTWNHAEEMRNTMKKVNDSINYDDLVETLGLILNQKRA